LPDETHLGVVRLQVSDIERSLRFYEQVMGFRALRTGDGGAILVARDQRPLVTLDTRKGVVPARRGAFGLYHFAILLPDRAALGRFAAHVRTTGADLAMADHLVSEALYLWDPDGLGIEVYADRASSGWRRRGPELLMATYPLDIADVIDAGLGLPWEGMPAGTTMGHVHLHVGRLDEAEAFYHSALGLDKMVWSYPGALFLAAGGYHHHLGTNIWATGPSASDVEARLLDWELIVPRAEDVADVANSLREAGYAAERDRQTCRTTDPWGTSLRIVPLPPPSANPAA
jgi:catechol 2,3-dioxygenase